MAMPPLTSDPKVTSQGPKTCPRCGSKDLLRQTQPDGRIELICLNLDCAFAQVLPASAPAAPAASADGFAEHLAAVSTDHLRQMADNLDRTCRTLTARPRRIARRQLALVTAELARRGRPSAASEPATRTNNALPPSPPPAGPPRQFQTAQAAENRVRAIREYYRQKRRTSAAGPWLPAFLESLHDEAARHEQAARAYARSPETLTLHIEYTAKAFELRRIIDRLTPYAAPHPETAA